MPNLITRLMGATEPETEVDPHTVAVLGEADAYGLPRNHHLVAEAINRSRGLQGVLREYARQKGMSEAHPQFIALIRGDFETPKTAEAQKARHTAQAAIEKAEAAEQAAEQAGYAWRQSCEQVDRTSKTLVAAQVALTSHESAASDPAQISSLLDSFEPFAQMHFAVVADAILAARNRTPLLREAVAILTERQRSACEESLEIAKRHAIPRDQWPPAVREFSTSKIA